MPREDTNLKKRSFQEPKGAKDNAEGSTAARGLSAATSSEIRVDFTNKKLTGAVPHNVFGRGAQR